MKPPPFTYHAPATVDEALDVLAEVGPDGKILAGGQSLIPLLNMRLVAPANLIDINRLDALDTIRVDDGGVHVGATVRAARLERDEQAAAACRLLRQALRLVAHPVVRNRGTVCGSIAHADPSGELPAVLALLGGTVHVAERGQPARDIPASEFFVGPLEPALHPGQLILGVTFPRTGPSTGTEFVELARRHGDYALCGVAARVDLGDDGRPAAARVALISVAGVPRVIELEEFTSEAGGAAAGGLDVDAAAGRVQEAIDPEGDIHATAEYRRHLAGVLTARALRGALARARARGAQGEGP